MSSERRSRSRTKRAEEGLAKDAAAGPAPRSDDTGQAEIDAAEAAADAAEAAADANAAEAEAAEAAAVEAAPDDDPETAARKAQRRAELEEARQAKLAKAAAKERDRAARAEERARRAVMREEREKANELIRREREKAQAEREAAMAADAALRAEREKEKAEREKARIERERVRAEREAAREKEKTDREARIAAIVAEREAREAANRRRKLTDEERAEARAYAEMEAPDRPSPWKFQLQVVKALVLRDMGSRFGTRSRLSYIWALLNPILLMIGLILVFSLRARVAPPNLPLLVFIMTGYPIWFGFYGMWGEVSKADDDPSMLMFPQVTVLDLIIARIVLEFATSTVVYVLLIAGAILLGRAPFPEQPMSLMFAYWGCCWLGAAFGLLICAIRRFMPMFEEWMMPLRRMGIFISGVIFTGTTLPSWTLPYFSWNPLFRAIEVARESWWASYQSPVADPGYVVLIAFGLSAVAIVAERLTRRYAGE